MQRILSILVLAVVVVGLAWLAICRIGPEAETKAPSAKVDLPRNALVTEAAVDGAPESPARKEVVGRYAVMAIAAGQPLAPEKLSGAPVLPPRAGLPWIGLPLGRDPVSKAALNVGDVVLVCGPEEPTLRPVRLGAVLCQGKQSVCTGFVRVAPKGLEALSKVKNPPGVYLGASCDGPPDIAETESSDPEAVVATADDDSADALPSEEEKDAGKNK